MVLLWVSALIVAGAAVAITTIPGQPLTAAQSAQLRPLPRCHRHHHHCRPRPAPTPTSPSPTPTSPASPTPTPTTPDPTPTSSSSPTLPPPPPPPGSAPSDPPAQICGNSAMLNGPSSPPAGAVTVPAGDDSGFEASFNLDPNTTYWFAPGVHTLGSGEFSQIQPREGDTFIGAPGAILSGQGQNDSAFAMDAPNVTIEYLTIQDFTPPGSQGAVNH